MHNERKTTIFLVISMLAWGSVYPVSKYLMSDISPVVLGFIRYFTAVVAMSPFFIIEITKNSNKFNIKSFLQITAAGLAGTAVFAVFLYSGVARSTASNGSIIINTQPIFAALLAPLLIKEVINRNQIIGVLCGFAGMFLVVTGGSFSSLTGGNDMLRGNLLLVLGAVSMSLYGIIIKGPVQKYGGIIATWLSMAIGTALLFIFNIFTVDDFFIQLGSPRGRDLLLILYLGSVATAAAYLLFSVSLSRVGVVTATAFKFLVPVSGVSLSVLFLGERPALVTYAGIFIVFFSVFLIQRSPVRISAGGKTNQ